MCEARLVYAALRIFKNIDVLVEHEAKASLIRRHIEIEGSRLGTSLISLSKLIPINSEVSAVAPGRADNTWSRSAEMRTVRFGKMLY